MGYPDHETDQTRPDQIRLRPGRIGEFWKTTNPCQAGGAATIETVPVLALDKVILGPVEDCKVVISSVMTCDLLSDIPISLPGPLQSSWQDSSCYW
jgi:hypothetical protein